LLSIRLENGCVSNTNAFVLWLSCYRQDIGEQRAYEKACQALREGAPDVRRKLAAQEIAAAALCSIGASAISTAAANTSKSRSRSDSDDYSDDRLTGSSAMQHSSHSHKRKGGGEHFADPSLTAPKHQKRSEQGTVHSRMSDMDDSNNEDANRRNHVHVQLLSTDADEDRNDVAATPRDYNDASDHTAATPTMTNQQREGVVTVVSSDRE
jgi:hypothetical protein